MTTQILADGLISSYKWNKTTITYSFKTTRLPYESSADYAGSVPVSSALQNATHEIFNYIGTLLNLDFIYEPDAIGDIVVSQKQMNDPYVLGYSYMPVTDTISSAADIYISSAFNDIDFAKGGMGYAAIIHELGHSLGLDHPFGSGTYPGVTIDESVMSYNPYTGYDSFNKGYYFATSSFTSYQPADILALQSIYGAKIDNSNNVYDLHEMLFSTRINGYTGTIEDNVTSIYDYGGNDTISLKNINSNNPQYIDLTPGSQSVIVDGQIHHYLSLTADTKIENVLGSNANDTIVLNNTNNTIDGGNGYDTVIENSLTTQTRIDVFENYTIVSGVDSGFDVMQNVEALTINNTNINLNDYQRELIPYNDTKTTQIGRLYLAVFDRVADKDGLNNWVNYIENDNTLTDVANSFIQSVEFISLYSDTQSNADFIAALYQNVLLRTPDIVGENYWLNAMDNNMSKADVVIGFSDSQEFINLTGIYFQDNMIVVS
ncbi:DUF4214 domain-containing protein [Sulfurimonas sp.]